MDDGLDERRRHQGGAEWLVDGARSAAQPQQVMAQLYDRLLCCGIPLWRAAISVSTLNPQIVARRFVWRPGGGGRSLGRPLRAIRHTGLSRQSGRARYCDRRDAPAAPSGPGVRWIFRSCWNGAPKV
jgi:hypothetical protein